MKTMKTQVSWYVLGTVDGIIGPCTHEQAERIRDDHYGHSMRTVTLVHASAMTADQKERATEPRN